LNRLPAKKYLASLRGDIFGGLTAAVVALPLALAFGVASGAGAIAGLLSQRHGRYVIVSGLKDHAYRALKGMRVLDRITAQQQLANRPDAIRAAVAHCRELEKARVVP
jgi:hypothetical protein